ncbi:unnamed protein product [Calypogeia fissa]
MPPLCAPSSHHLLSEPRPVASAPFPEENNEDDDRAEMVASLVTAIADAEAAAAAAEGNNDEQSPERQHQFASQAYGSLCFDFPIVPTNALAALADAFRSSSLGTGAPIFPITEKFTSGLRYLVSIESTKQSSLDGVAATEDECDSNFGCNRLFELCGCVFLLAPALRLAAAHKDGGAALQGFLATYDSSSIDLVEHHHEFNDEFSTDGVGTTQLEHEVHSTLDDDVAAEMDNDDFDWEDLEVSIPPLQRVISEEPKISRHEENTAWSELMDKVALLIGSVPAEVINSGVWGGLQLTEHLIHALNGMRMLERLETEAVVGPIATLYADFLSDHLLSSWSTSASEVTQVLSALMALVDSNGQIKQRRSSKAVGKDNVNPWNVLVLSTLAKICAKVGGYPAQRISPISTFAAPFQRSTSNGVRKHGSRPSSAFVRNLWQTVFSSMQFLEVQLTEAQGEVGSNSQLEMVLWVLYFFVKFAPGNIDLRATLLEGGIFRTALQLFVQAGGDPQMEPLRQFLLLSMASSSSLAEFAAKVPSFTTAMSEADHCAEGSYAKAHAAIWPLILRAACRQSSSSKTAGGHANLFESGGVEASVVAAFDGVVEAVADDTMNVNPFFFLNKLVWLHVILALLEDATSVSSRSAFRLWQRRSPLDVSIDRCQSALGSLSVQVTEKASISSPRPISHHKKSEDVEDNAQLSDDSIDNSNDSNDSTGKSILPSAAHDTELVTAQEKLKELLPSLLLKLKVLSALTKENREAKID